MISLQPAKDLAKMTAKPIKTRFAPSPTGLLHIGGARTALFSWAFARKNGGSFALRVEDTDLARSTDASTQAILDGMRWLGLDWDEGPVYQAQWGDWHRELAQKLIDQGLAFRCFDGQKSADSADGAAPKKGEKAYRSPWRDRAAGPDAAEGPFAVRFKAPDSGDVTFTDLVKGSIRLPAAQMDDWVILRSDGSPTYNFACAADDWRMGITHVIRGDDHVANTPKQILVWQALGAEPPQFAHLPMLLDASGKKLSKRNQGEAGKNDFPTDLDAMRQAGLTAPGLVNYLARLGWAHGDDEVFTLEQFTQWFDLSGVNPAPAKVNLAKLHWVNAQHLKAMDDADLWAWAKERAGDALPASAPATWPDVAAALRARGRDTQAMERDVATLAGFWTENEGRALIDRLSGAANAAADPSIQPAFALAAQAAASAPWTPDGLDAAVKGAAESAGVEFGPFARALREKLTGASVSLPIPAMLLALGREKACAALTALAAGGAAAADADVEGAPGATQRSGAPRAMR
jgi:glutamyl-tRNA synthetase